MTSSKEKIKITKRKKNDNKVSNYPTKKNTISVDSNTMTRLDNSSYSDLVEEAINNTLFEKNFLIRKNIDKAIKDRFDQIEIDKEDIKPNIEGDIYPDLNDVEFNYKISKKKEFISFLYPEKKKNFVEEVEDLIDKRKNNIFNLSLSQQFLRNYISPETPYNGILLMHGTGVGKTCSAITIAEQFIPYALKSDQKIIIISSELIGKQFIKEIFDIEKYLESRKNPKFNKEEHFGCTGSKYLNILENTYDKESLSNDDFFRKEMKKLINSRYFEPVGYKKFTNEVIKKERDAIINILDNDVNEIERAKSKIREKYYSNSVIIIDELHNIKDDDNTDTKNIPPIIEKVIRDGRNNKLILLTATPMFNSATEIIYILNLLLLNDKRNLIKKSDIFNSEGEILEEGKEILSKVLNSYVSFVKGQNPYIFPFRLYPDINKDVNILDMTKYPQNDFKYNTKISKDDISMMKNIKIVSSVMKKNQFHQYLKNLKLEPSNQNIKIQNNNFNNEISNDTSNYISLCQLSTFSFPDGELGRKNFKKYFDAKSQFGPFSYRQEIVEQYGYFLSRHLIDNYSCKFSTILNYIINSSGPVFVYTEWVWNGVIPFALMLEQNGYKRYGEGVQLLNEKKENISYDGRFESSFNKNEKFIQGNYIILTGQQQGINEVNRDQSISIFNSPENKDGKLIKIFLASKAGSEGLDLKGIREVHICDPWWNFNRNEQTIGRAIRNFSHFNLPLEKRNVTIYNHAIINPKDSPYHNSETIDLYKYRISMKKKMIINQIEEIIKKRAVDCYLNNSINFFPKKKINYSFNIVTSQNKLVKYQVGDEEDLFNKNIECDPDFVIKPDDVDNSTFSEYFEESNIEKITKSIKNLFLKESYLTIDNIINNLLNHQNNKNINKNDYEIEKKIIYRVINNLIDSQEKIRGSFGRIGNIIYKNGYYIFKDQNKNIHYLSDNNIEVPIDNKNNYGLVNLKNIKKLDILEDTKENIIDYIENKVKKLLEDISKKKIYLEDKFWNGRDEIILQLLYDLVIDSLDMVKKEILFQFILKYYKVNQPKINSKILESSKIYIYKLNKLDNYFYKLFEGSEINFFYIHPNYPNNINDQEFIKVKKNISSEILKQIKFNPEKFKIYGSIVNSEFKMVNNNSIDNISSGVVCGNLKKHMISYAINNLIGYDKYNNDGMIKDTKNRIKIQKPSLCIELQLLFRFFEKYNNENKTYFIRDFEFYSFMIN